MQYGTEVTKGRYPLDRIMNSNVATNTSDIVTPDFLNLKSGSFSPSGDKVLFLANSNPGEEISIYISQKKTE